MSKRRLVSAFFVALVISVSACQSQPVTYYTPPAEMPAGQSATVIGSKVPVPNIFFADEVTYLVSIDSLPVEGGSKHFDSPVPVSPGPHVIIVGFSQGSGCAKASFELKVESGERYIARGEKLGRESLFRQEDLRLWIEDSEGNAVTDDVIVPFGYCGGGFGLIVV